MQSSRPKRALVWLALAAVAVVSVARLQSGIAPVRGYAHSVLAYIAAAQNETATVARGVPAFRNAAARSSHDSTPAPLLALLPVFFIGLVAPLCLSLTGSTLSLGRPSPAPALPFRFQRPPPAQLL
ncbi:MAG: hypothetical protein ACLGSD_11515 [Acidobacteriota bacterium]